MPRFRKAYLEAQTVALHRFFNEKYPATASTTTPATAGGLSAPRGATSFAALDQGTDEDKESDERLRYFDAPRPAEHIYSGSAVAVERVFSGGRDTISLRRACLKPETIRTLMLIKYHLRLKRRSLEDALRIAEVA
ncbi:hypothetical protein B0H19DRAFT_1271532 [Mycena capillaripes]|nr:hypothetical protein B0H19DRAFT_1271532 [Mycena capillaripes]